ncbi:MAG: hypothetical protein JSW60_09060 [Thermoplasmatales archaeon]|nr:MAG: hypothetical protein JSW60_09060 [Thermoplasmatales archaeon]
MLRKGIALAVILLFISVSVIPSTGNISKVSTIYKSNNPPYEPSNPCPPNGSTNWSCPGGICWTGGDPDGDEVAYDVYFGKTSPPSKEASKITSNCYRLISSLDFNTTYYWKIVAWDEHGASTEGPIWSFTTRDNTTVYPNPPYGPSRGIVGKEYIFCTQIPFIPVGNSYYIIWDWGDGEFSNWLGPYDYGDRACASHIWNASGDFDIKIRLKEIHGNESNWSDPWTFTVVDVTMLYSVIQMVFFGQIDAFIVNLGNDTAYDVDYSIDVKVKGIVFGLEKMHKNGTKDMLPSGSILIWTISTGFIGIGWFKITITANAFNAEKVSSTLKVLILLCFVKIL